MQLSQIGYIESEISKTNFAIFLALGPLKTALGSQKRKNLQETLPDWVRLKQDFQNCL